MGKGARLPFQFGADADPKIDISQDAVPRGQWQGGVHRVVVEDLYSLFLRSRGRFDSSSPAAAVTQRRKDVHAELENIRDRLPVRYPNAPRNERPESNSLANSCVRLLNDAENLLASWDKLLQPVAPPAQARAFTV